MSFSILGLFWGLGVTAREVQSLWEEYEANESEEARVVKDFDKVRVPFIFVTKKVGVRS